jgi:hypothetical protein
VNLPRLEEEFAVRYYYWALQDFEREIEQDFPFLGTFTSGSAWHVRDMMSQMGTGDRRFLARALVKRFHERALRALGEAITEEEKQMCQEYFDKALLQSPRESYLEARLRAGERHALASRRKLCRLIGAELRGRQIELDEDGCASRIIATTGNRWRVVTEIDTSNRHAQLIYHHDVVIADREEIIILPYGGSVKRPIPIVRFVSLNAWLGISGQTEWSDLMDDDLPQVASALGGVCSVFLEAAPKLLKGL